MTTISILPRPRVAGAASVVAKRGAGIDHGRAFMAEELTPLFHVPGFGVLPGAVRRRYNQLHALYFNEQVAFFEQEMLSPALRALRADRRLPRALAEAVETFHAEEQRHTAMFRGLNRRAAPEFYGAEDYFFIRLPAAGRGMLRALSGQPRWLPLVLWLALLQEERSLYYSKRCLTAGEALEPRFAAVHRAHLADEAGHVDWDELLLDWLWPRTPRTLRAINARLMRWTVAEFFHLPKRSARHVVGQLAREFPGAVDARALCGEMDALATNTGFLRTLYSPQIAPRSFARYAGHAEFAPLARLLDTP